MKLAHFFYLKDEITKNKNNKKQLYKQIAKLTGVQKDNPMPNAHSNHVLAEHFVDFFVDKIMEIQNELDQYALYEPGYRDRVATMNMFYLVTDDMIKELV